MVKDDQIIDPRELSDEELFNCCIDTLLSRPDDELKRFEMQSFYLGCVQGIDWREKIWFKRTSPERAEIKISITNATQEKTPINYFYYADIVSTMLSAMKEYDLSLDPKNISVTVHDDSIIFTPTNKDSSFVFWFFWHELNRCLSSKKQRRAYDKRNRKSPSEQSNMQKLINTISNPNYQTTLSIALKDYGRKHIDITQQ